MTVPPAALHVTVDVEGPTDLLPAATSNNMDSTQLSVTMPATHASYLFLQLAPNSASLVTQFKIVPATMNVLPAAVHIAVDLEGCHQQQHQTTQRAHSQTSQCQLHMHLTFFCN